jgi:hypothetical protein
MKMRMIERRVSAWYLPPAEADGFPMSHENAWTGERHDGGEGRTPAFRYTLDNVQDGPVDGASSTPALR